MVNLLAKLFIKNYKNVDNEKVRTQYGTLCGGFGIITNLILVTIKLIIGILSLSISIIADAINNLSDMGSSIITIIGFKISSKPADKKHPFGHQRVEYIVGLIISMIIIFVGIELLSQSIGKIITPSELDTSLLTYILLGVSILLKLIQGLFYLSASKKINSISLKASSKDSFNDMISTSVVLIGVLISPYIGYNLDGVLGVAVSIFIIVTACLLLKDTMSPLIGEKPDPEIISSIKEFIMNYEGVLGIHDVVVHTYGPSKIFITLHVEVDAKRNILETHDIIDNIEQDIKQKYGIEITIHMDPIEIDDEERKNEKETITKILREIDDNLKFHDFRLVRGPTHTNLIFDVLVPFEYKIPDEELVNIIKQKVSENNPIYRCVITIDKDYID